MKIPALLIALALAGGTALAQAPSGSAKMSGDSTAPAAAPAAAPAVKAHAPAKVHKQKVVHKKSQKKVETHASAHHATRKMGAGAAAPMTDLDAGARQRRIDQAYADWRARHR